MLSTRCADGADSLAALLQGTDGNFYGTTIGGGAYCTQNSGCGTVFKITPSGMLTTLHSFDDTDDGKAPFAGLVHATDGNFYGTTAFGANPACTTGLHGCGTVFRLSGPPPSTTTVTSSPNPSTFGRAGDHHRDRGSRRAAGADRNGELHVEWHRDFRLHGSAAEFRLTAVCTTSTLAVGTDAIVATYSGDTNYSGSSGTLMQIVNPVPMALQFVALSPCRVVDTRNANGTFGGPPIPGNNCRSFPLTEGDNPCGIPSSAIAYSAECDGGAADYARLSDHLANGRRSADCLDPELTGRPHQGQRRDHSRRHARRLG